MGRFRAPGGNGEVLADPGFDAIPRLVEENRRRLDRTDVTIGGLPLRELRALARREVLELSLSGGCQPPEFLSRARGADTPRSDLDTPLLLAGHQPELAHPGVWVKNFALNGLARKLGGIPLHLVVDNDTLKSTSLRFPVVDHDPEAVHLQSLAFDRIADGLPYEYTTVRDENAFRSFAEHVASLTNNWGFSSLLESVWSHVVSDPMPWIGVKFTNARAMVEREWGGGNLELPVHRLAEQEAFGRFVGHLLGDADRFREVYNAAVSRYRMVNGLRSQNHPVPDLIGRGDWIESPFWGQQYGGYYHARRGRLFARRDGTEARVDNNPPVPIGEAVRTFRIRPRALTLTLFARVCLGDFFIHGIGGGKYDEVTDAIIRDYFGLEPPAYQVLSATLHLPLPGFPATADDVTRAERLVRDLHWNPQRHLTPENAARPEVRALLAEKESLTANEPATDRREWFRALQRITERLQPFVRDQVAPAEANLIRTRTEAAANAVLRRRDYAWVLYPEETLRPFLQQFLTV